MKRVLIVGKNSYIGNHVEDWLSGAGMQVDKLSVRDDAWKDYDYSQYDSVLYVAAIVHRKDAEASLYQKVNVQIPLLVAQRAKSQGVTQFVYFSSMAVYGVEKALFPVVIDKSSPLEPVSPYGKSKLQAEYELLKLHDSRFHVVLLRLPNVYGRDCKGNYISGFVRIVRTLPLIPVAYEDIHQSMIYIDNVCELVKQAVSNNLHGIYCPQDDVAVSAVELMSEMAKALGVKRCFSTFLGKFVRYIPIARKVYGGIEYARELSQDSQVEYQVVPFREAIIRTVKPDV
ncbi:MAG: NAD-dependent epimerase/dehydratase family protein [Bacteroidales bacterium]|nr:NAD-dependent epimerase/dehydratase family protein [Bacteroidales bacterium]